MSPSWIAAAATAGLAAGPGQRVLVCAFAVPAGQPLQRGCCPACGTSLPCTGRRLPGTTALTGRCPRCGRGVGPRPLTTELITGVACALLAMRAHSVAELGALCLLAAAGIALAFVDAAVHRLPDLLTLATYLAVVALLLITAATGHQWDSLQRAVLAGVALACFYFALAVIPAGVGAGDAKLALPVGTMLGWYGWPVLLAGTFYGFVVAAAYAVTVLAVRHASRADRIAFSPFILSGAFVAILTAAADR